LIWITGMYMSTDSYRYWVCDGHPRYWSNVSSSKLYVYISEQGRNEPGWQSPASYY